MKDGGKKWLVVALSFLGVLIVGLVIIVIVVNLNNSNSGENENIDDETANLTDEEKYVKSLVDKDASYQISSEISSVYNGGNKEEALRMYDEELNKALEAEDYDLYNSLFIARSTMLNLDGTCEELMAQYDKVNADMIPKEYRDSIYSTIINDSASCGDVERETYWRTILNE